MPHVNTMDMVGRENERNDCSVRAVASLACLPYSQVHAEFAKQGRKNRCCTPSQITAKVMSGLGLIRRESAINGTELRAFRTWAKVQAKLDPKKWYLIETTGHHFAYIEGTEYNNRTAEKPKRWVRHVFEIVL